MVHSYQYAVLLAIPDPGRGERVNVGIMVFLPERIDVRFAELSKVRALTGSDWTAYAESLRARIIERFDSERGARVFMDGFNLLDKVFRASELAWLSIESIEAYEGRVREILASLVMRPREDSPRPKSNRINTEIARFLTTRKLLARRDEPLASHKVVRDLFIEDELRADFAQQNGIMRVAATLDLRRPHADIKEATLKAIVLDRARSYYPKDAQRFGIYAAMNVESEHTQSRIKLLSEYSTEVFNWESPSDRGRLLNLIHTGVGTLFSPP